MKRFLYSQCVCVCVWCVMKRFLYSKCVCVCVCVCVCGVCVCVCVCDEEVPVLTVCVCVMAVISSVKSSVGYLPPPLPLMKSCRKHTTVWKQGQHRNERACVGESEKRRRDTERERERE